MSEVRTLGEDIGSSDSPAPDVLLADKRRLVDMVAGNNATAKRLAQQARVQIPDLQIRLETLLDLIFEPADRLTYELEFERRRAVALAQLQAGVNKAKLASPLVRTPAKAPVGLIRP